MGTVSDDGIGKSRAANIAKIRLTVMSCPLTLILPAVRFVPERPRLNYQQVT